MTRRVDLYSAYGDFEAATLAAIRRETFGVDIGQNSWTTVDEHERFVDALRLLPEHHVLEVASGSGGPALHLANRVGCRLTGIDANQQGVDTASRAAAAAGLDDRVQFQLGDACAPLPFADGAFDALLCIDSMNHFPDRAAVFRQWRRVLRTGRRALLTDPVVITGPVTNDDLALRSSIGVFLFVPPGVNERLLDAAGFALVETIDATGNAVLTAGRWHDARKRHREALLRLEGIERFDALQEFFAAVHRLCDQRRLSRLAYLVEAR